VKIDEAKIQEIYEALPEPLLAWYRGSARDLPWRRDREPYHVWLSEIMLQQTRVEAVKLYYTRFLAELPTVEALAATPEEKLLKLWEGLGYYNRARNLQKAARAVVQEYGGRFPDSCETLLSLPGIGAYTAGAVASICFEWPSPAVDGNVLRVLARLCLDFRCVDTPEVKRDVTQRLAAIYPEGHCGDFSQALMELGAVVCVPNGAPKCDACPLARLCLARQSQKEQDLPVKAKKKSRKIQTLTVFVLRCPQGTALCKRGPAGVLSGLWELPNVEGFLPEAAAFRTAANWGVLPEYVEKRVERRHIFTHIEWHMRCYFIACAHPSEQFFWAEPAALENDIALPTAFKKILE